MRRLVLVLTACACAREFSVPPPVAKPTIASFTPAQAFATDYLYIHGTNFDPKAEANLVQFGYASARAFAFDTDGALLVAVPDGPFAQSGAISVTTPAGVSDLSAGQFTFRGPGHLRQATLVGTTQLLHRPPGIAFVGGELLIASRMMRGVISSSGLFASLGSEPLGLAPNNDLTAVYAGTLGRVTRVKPNGDTMTSSPVPGQAFRLLAANAVSLYGVGEDTLGVPQAYAFDPETLAVQHNVSLAGLLDAASDIGAPADGRVALSGTLAGAWGVLLLDPAAPEAAVFTAAPAEMAGPIDAVDSGIAVAFADGTARVLSTGAVPAWGPVLHTGAFTPATVLIATGPRFGVADAREQTVALIDPSTATPDVPVWKAPVPHTPVAIDYDGVRFYVAYSDSNDVDAFDGATGTPMGRAVFPIGAGNSVLCGQGSAVDMSGTADTESRLLVMSRKLSAIISVNADSLAPNAPIPLAAGTSPGRALVRDRDLLPLDNSVIWVLHDHELGTLGNAAAQDRNVETVRITGLVQPPDCLLFPAGGAMIVGGGNDISVYRGNVRTGGITLDGALLHMAVDFAGRIFVVTGDPTHPGASPKAATYDVSALEAGGAPAASFAGTSGFSGFVGAEWTYYGPMLLFTWDAVHQVAGGFGLMLDDSLAPSDPFSSLVDEDGPLGTPPDGLLVLWMRRNGGDHVLHFAALLSDDFPKGIYEYAAVKLNGDPVAPISDATGEYLYLPIPENDEIATYR